MSQVSFPQQQKSSSAQVIEMQQLRRKLKTMQQSEARFRTLADNIPQLAWIADEQGWIFWYNKRWYEYTGTRLEDMQGWGWRKIHHPEHVDRVVEGISACFRIGNAWEDIFPLRGANGEYRWFQACALPIHDESGGVVGWFGTNTDITEQQMSETAVRASEHELLASFEHAALGILNLSYPDYRLLWVNRAIGDMLGYSSEDLHGRPIAELVLPEDLAMDEMSQHELIEGRRQFHVSEKRLLRKDGSIIWARIRLSVVRDKDQSIRYQIALVEDITDARQAQSRLRDIQTRLTLAKRVGQIGFWEFEPSTGNVFFSPVWKRQLGYEDIELQDSYDEFDSRLHPDDATRVHAERKRFIAHPSEGCNIEFRLKHKDGTYRWIWSHAVALFDEQGQVAKIVGSHIDVTERKCIEEKMRQMAQYDALTGLPNRSLIYELAHQLLASARRNGTKIAVMFFDLDRFKPVNDTYGHELGDKMLQEVATRLKNSVREEDVVGRLGGDEFMAMLTGIRTSDDVRHASVHLLDRLRQPYVIDNVQFSTSPSIGVSLFPDDGQDIDALIRHADAAMYHAKENGRNRVEFFSPEVHVGVQRTLTTEQRLRRALDHGEFELFYQPIIGTQDERLAGMEALIRWHPANPEAMGPAEFIPIAETSGLINNLGDWVMQEACRQHTEWCRQGLPPIRIAVNVSPIQFRSRDFLERVSALLSAAGIDPGWLELELTEGTVMRQVEDATRTLSDLKQLGVSISLDDFGTGYSSLSYLAMLPIDKIKVDRSFIRNIEQDSRSRAITETVIALGKKIGVQVVAEGIESTNAFDLLRESGCDLGQGYLLSRPLPAREVPDWFRRQSWH